MSHAMSFAPGSIFAGDFRIERPLAEGGMGSVYIAEQVSTGQRRALKVMQPQLLPDERSRQRFLEEARIGSRIQSEHVVQVVAAGVDLSSGIPWLAMELLDGADLDQYLRARGPLPASEALEILEQAAHALAAAHAKGIIHRDLKPENLFVARTHRRGAELTVKILDFGIARTVAESRAAATVTNPIGSPLWMAPEQAQSGAKLRPSTDVWAFGLIAFYALTGRHYWLAANHEHFNLQALLVEVLTQSIDPPSARARALGAYATLPAGFDTWFAHCVARDTEARFPDAAAAIEGLRATLSVAHAPTAPVMSPTQPLASYPAAMAVPTAVRPEAPPSSAMPMIAALAVAGLLVAAVGVGGALLLYGGGDDGEDTHALEARAPAAPIEAVEPAPLAQPTRPVEPPAPTAIDPVPSDPAPSEPAGPPVLEPETRSERPEPPARDPEPPARRVDPPSTSDPARSQRARECTMRGDNRCVISELEGHARSESELAMLIEAYRATGNRLAADRHMRSYVSRFPQSARARNYRQLLEQHGATEDRPRTGRASDTAPPNGYESDPY
jgi:serine/threonine protein kinase